MSEDRHLATQIAIGWVLHLIVLVFALLTSVVFSIYDTNNFVALFDDPGPKAMRASQFGFLFVTLLPVYVYVVSEWRNRLLRWLVVALAGAMLMWSLMHHLSHVIHNELPTLAMNMSYVADHIVLAWILYNAIRWSRIAVVPVEARS